jgi:hypothetical protein
MKNPEPFAEFPALAALWERADDLHVLTFDSRMQLRDFLAALLSYMPGWMRCLYRVRKGFVALLGANQDGIPEARDILPQDVSFTPGHTAAFFTVIAAQEERFWLAEARDEIITGYLGVVVEDQGQGAHRFHFISGATWRNWRGRLYYTAILPFHHLVIRCMLKNARKRNARTTLAA